MQTATAQILDSQKASWNKFSSGWRKWDDLAMSFIQSHADEIIKQLNPKSSDLVLDIASGTGEPGLTIAKLLTDGKVIMSDLAEGMLDVANDKAKAMDIQNVETIVADACTLPFEDNTFDLISCRLGFMFFPDMELAAEEMARVLKPGGRIATTVWGSPEKNYWITCMVQNIKKHIEMPTPPKGAPGMFRCAKPGLVLNLLKNAGLKNTGEREVNDIMQLKSPEIYWDFMTEIAAPFVAALSNVDENTVNKIKNGVIESLNQKYLNGISIGTGGFIVWGEK